MHKHRLAWPLRLVLAGASGQSVDLVTGKALSFPTHLLGKLQSRSQNLNRQLQQSTEKMLQGMAQREAKLQKKLTAFFNIGYMQKFPALYGLAILCLFVSTANGQSGPNLVNVFRPAPNTAGLQKYAEIPVSPYTGVPNISLPLYTVNFRDITLPVTLGYHASGIKVGEEASHTGLGWALNAGGQISRNIVGYDDFTGSGYCINSPPFKDYINGQRPNQPAQMGCLLSCLNLTVAQSPTTYTDDLSTYLNTTRYDFEPDQYYFNFMGKAGKFVLTRNGQAVLQSQEAVQINVSGPDGLTWQVKSEDGFIYDFTERETYTDISGSMGGSQEQHTTAWYLTKITSPHGNVVTIRYKTISFDNMRTVGAYSESRDDADLPSGTGNMAHSTGHQYGPLPGNQYLNPVVDTINFTTGFIKFNYSSGRDDLPGDQRLDSINVVMQDLPTQNFYPLKTVQFVYDYFTASTDLQSYQSPDGNPLKRLKLVQVKETGYLNGQPTGQNLYKLNYYEGSGLDLPPKTSFARDHWGYYNGKTGNASLIPSTSFGPATGDFISDYLGTPNHERDPDTSYAKANSLRSIEYPTGGSTEFQYEPNDFDEQLSQVNDQSFFQSVPTLVGESQNQLFDAVANHFVTTDTLDLSSAYVKPPSSATLAHIDVTFRFGNDICSTTFQTGKIYFSIYDSAGQLTAYQNKDLALFNPCGNPPSYPCVTCNSVAKVYKIDISLAPGKYVIKVTVDPAYQATVNLQDIAFNTTFSASVTSNAVNYANTNAYAHGGGIRIKRVIDHDNINPANDKIRHYTYHYLADKNSDGINEEYSFGRRMSKPVYSYFVTTQDSQDGGPDIPVTTHYQTIHLTRASESNNQLNGSAAGNCVGYDQVTELFGENGENGKRVYEYHNMPDIVRAYNDPNTFLTVPIMPPQGSNEPDPLNGLLLHQVTYKNTGNSFVKIEETRNTYATTYPAQANAIYGIQRVGMNSFINGSFQPGVGCNVYLLSHVAMRIDWTRMDSTIQKTFSSTDTNKYVQTITTYEYGNSLHYLPTKIKTTTSTGDVLVTYNKYPLDFTISGTATDNAARGIQNLQNQHLVNPLIEQYVQRTNADGSNARTVSGTFTTYMPLSPYPTVINGLETVQPLTDYQAATVSTSSATLDSRSKAQIYLDGFDAYGNILQQHRNNDVVHSYVWDYKNTMPVAEAINAASSAIAYTSFEADGNGNWSFAGSASTDNTAPTGSKVYNLNGGSISKTVADTGTYIVSYWSKNGVYTLSVAGSTVVTGKTVDGWTCYEHTVRISTANTSLTLSAAAGTHYIDEVRLYPASAQMVTRTYIPLVGVTSECDISNRITYYGYDAFQRLAVVRDQDKNIIKTICYSYTGQPTACSP